MSPALSVLPRRWSWFLKCLPNVYTQTCYQLSRFGPTAVRHRLPQLRRSQKLFLGAITLRTGVALMTPPYTVSHPHMPTYKVMMTMKSRLGNGPHTRPKIQLFIETVCKIVFSRRVFSSRQFLGMVTHDRCSNARTPCTGHPQPLFKFRVQIRCSIGTVALVLPSRNLSILISRYRGTASPQYLRIFSFQSEGGKATASFSISCLTCSTLVLVHTKCPFA